MTACGPLHESLASPRAGPRFAPFQLFPHPPAHSPASVALQQHGPCMWVINSNVSRKEQIRLIKPSAAYRLQNQLPVFKQAAEPDAFGASFRPIRGADAFSGDNGQIPPSPEEGSPQNESVFTSKLEEILNKFRTREKRSSSGDDPYALGRRNEAAPSAPQSETIAHQREFFRQRRLGMAKGNAGGGLYNTENATFNSVDTSTPLPRERQRVHSRTSKTQTFTRKGSSNFAGAHTTKSSQSSVYGNKQRSLNSDLHKAGHWSTRVEKTREPGKGRKPFSTSPNDHKPDAMVSEFDWTDSDEEDELDTASSITSDDGASSSFGKKADQPSSGSSTGATTDNPSPLMNGNIAAWHNHTNPNLPFEFQYSYSETPKAPIIRYREEPYSPFGPDTLGRPWTGGPPLKKSKKNLPQFDSFKPPPAKKGIKFVQSPGPFPEGQGPKPARSREEILGKPLTGEEIVELVDSCRSERRQLNLGRDGLTHNMLDLIHCHWKRRRVVKVRCLGVPTVDMDNVCFHLEDKTGGKIIYRSGGSVYLFRGRNYNYKDRPVIPIMLWKPITPVYPKLIKRAPEGLTKEEADELRLLGRKVEPLCTLVKNGVYLSLVKDVRAAFRVDDLVRINCRGSNPSDYKKIGAKLRDLVPCVLLSFDDEQILMWKGKSMVSANVDAGTSNGSEDVDCFDAEATKPSAACGGGDDESCSAMEEIKPQALVVDTTGASTLRSNSISAGAEGWPDNSMVTGSTNQIKDDLSSEDLRGRGFLAQNEVNSSLQFVLNEDDIKSDKADPTPEYSISNGKTLDIMPGHERESHTASDSELSESRSFMELRSSANDQEDEQVVSKTVLKLDENLAQLESSKNVGAGKEGLNDACVIRVDTLWDHAIASGMAIQLDQIHTDSDVVVKKASELDKSVPAAAEYTQKLQKKLWIRKKTPSRPDDDLRIHFANLYKAKNEKKAAKKAFRVRRPVDVPDNGGLPVEELARLLSIK